MWEVSLNLAQISGNNTHGSFYTQIYLPLNHFLTHYQYHNLIANYFMQGINDEMFKHTMLKLSGAMF